MIHLQKYKTVQNIAKNILKEIPKYIHEESTEETIADKCIELLRSKGIYNTWYYNTPALVLLGKRSCLSISGKEYIPNNQPVGTKNLITIDLSPLQGKIWGDYARSFIFNKGTVIFDNFPLEFNEGIIFIKKLHSELISYAKPDTLFDDLYYHFNHIISENGFENIDFLGNLGHSIETEINLRKYIEPNNKLKLKNVKYFTFEPHIRKTNGKWGFKLENIYFFDKHSNLEEL